MENTATVYTSKAALVAAMRTQITGSARKAQKALIRIYDNQTQDEKGDRDVKHANDKGFVRADAWLLSGFARWVLAGHELTEKQFAALRDRIGKYAGQLVDQSIARGLIQKKDGTYLWGKGLQAALAKKEA